MMLDIDVRPLLPAIQVPVVDSPPNRRDGGRRVASRYLAEHIPGARYVELASTDHLPWIGDVEPILAEVQELVTGRGRNPNPTASWRRSCSSMRPAARATASRRWRAAQIDRFRGHPLAAGGDSLGASFDGPARAIHCAEAIVAESNTIGIRAALHTGECEPRDGELRGVAVDVAAEILARASPGEVLVSRTVADLVAGAKISFVDRGSHTLATVGDPWQLLAASAGEAPAQPAPGEPAMQSGVKGTTGRSRSAGS